MFSGSVWSEPVEDPFHPVVVEAPTHKGVRGCNTTYVSVWIKKEYFASTAAVKTTTSVIVRSATHSVKLLSVLRYKTEDW